jgi:SPP1 family predicted phage head-tail adaptor
MRSGPLRKRVTLQSQSITQDSHGAPVASWVEEAVVWASITPMTGTEFFAAAARGEEKPVRVMIRYSSDVESIDSTWRVVYGTRVFNILSIINVKERDEMLALACIEGRDSG